MGFSFGPKTLAIALTALTHGDRLKAEKVWAEISHEDFDTWRDAWDRIEHVLEQLDREALADEPAAPPHECGVSVYIEYPVGRCSDAGCSGAEPHRHGLACDKACTCVGVGAIIRPCDDYSVPTCDWGSCNRETVAERLEVDITRGAESWLSVCSWHAGWDDAEPSDLSAEHPNAE